jgi:4-aminobutyrate aminotransferase-like enzyme
MTAFDRIEVGSRTVSLRQRHLHAVVPPRPVDAPVAAGAMHQDELSGTGLTLRCADGREYLDAASGTFNLPLGYDHPVLVERIRAQLGRAAHVSSHFTRDAVAALGAKLLRWAPARLGAVWLRDLTGSTAIEGAIKIAQKATGRTDIVSVFLAHHGQTHLATAISGNAFRREHQPDAVAAHSIKVPAPYCHRCFYEATHPSCALRCARRIQDFIDHASSGRVAAVIIEPVLGNGGNIVPPAGYFDELRRVCDRNGCLLIVDEVQTGIGRTGAMFACETFGIEPDLLVTAKGLGGIGIPVGAILMRRDLAVLEAHEHSFTSGANLLALAAADATLAVIGAPGFLAEVRRKTVLLRRSLTAVGAACPLVSDVRGVGFMWGLEIVDRAGAPSAELANRVIDVALHRHALIVRGSRYGRGNTVKVRPALVATDAEVGDVTARLARALREVADEVGA